MQLEEFFDYKNRLMSDLLTSESIVSLLNEDTAVDDGGSLVYKQVFPFEYIPETIQSGHTYICCDVDVYDIDSKTFLTPVLYIWVFSHRSKLRLPEGGVRTDKLCSEICKVVNGSKFYGLGEINIRSVKRFAPLTDYQGKVLTFYAKDFNRQYDGRKSIPVNRRRP